jgi:5-methyltetrahydropteroyltriglutamate--homocysteine methyltransferase
MPHLLPTELIGSYALPSWLWIVIDRIEAQDDLGESDLRETLDDAAAIALGDQLRAGVDIVTDGEMRRRDFIQSFYGRIQGVQSDAPERRFGAAGYDQNPRHQVVDRVAAPRGLGIAHEVEYLKQRTDRKFKICVPGPITLSMPLAITSGYANRDSLLADFIEIVNAEMRALVAAGATYIQVDEPRYATSRKDAEQLIDIFNATRAGITAEVGLHICFGNFRGRSRDKRDYQYIIPSLGRASCDQVNLEFANRELSQIELIRDIGGVCRIGIGVIDVKSYFVETPQQVADDVRRALRYTAAERIVVTPDCGFNHTPRHIAFRKICAMVEGAALLRRELAGQAN